MREVTEQDFRKEEFVGVKPEDYEFREDGVIVRKDRWSNGIRIIASILDFRDFEVSDVVDEVKALRDINKTYGSEPMDYIFEYHAAISKKNNNIYN